MSTTNPSPFRVALAALASCALVSTGALARAQCEEAKLTSSQPVDGGDYGSAVDINGDRAIVGQPVGIGFGESAYVYERTGSGWIEAARLTPPGQVLDVSFGALVAIEGDVAAVAAPGDDQMGPDLGAFHVFERLNGVWTWTQKLHTTTGLCGRRAIDIDQGVIFHATIAGAPAGFAYGSVDIFEKVGGAWAETQRIYTPQVTSLFDTFPEEIQTHEGTLAAAFVYDVPAAENHWQIQFYERPGPGLPFALVETLDSPNDEFRSLAVFDFDDDSLALASYTFVGKNNLHFYRRSMGSWTLVQQFPSTDFLPSISTNFGGCIAVEGDLIVMEDTQSYSPLGAILMFTYDGSDWTPRGHFQGTDSVANDFFAVELDSHDGRVIVGAERHPQGGSIDGAAYIFDVSVLPEVYCTGKLNSLGCTASVEWHGAPSLTNVWPFDVTATSILSNKPGLFFYGTSGRANVPFLGGTLCALPPLTRTPPISSGGSGPPDDCTGVLAIDLNARIQSGVDPDLVPGTVLNGQFWSRDPNHPDGTGVHLTEAIEAPICP